MSYLKSYLLEDRDPTTIEHFIVEWRTQGEPGPLHHYLGLTWAELSLYQRDAGLFFKYLATTKATRRAGCG